MEEKRVSFVMGVLNGERTIAASIESVLKQTIGTWELIIVDDGSTDTSAALVRDYSQRDARVRLIQNDKNRGIPFTMNRGIAAAHGTYIARLDADDLAVPTRAERQAAYLDTHPQTTLVGGWMACFTADDPANGTALAQDGEILRYPTEAGSVAAGLVFRNTLAHPAVMMRRAGLPRYDESFAPADDYALWATMAARGMRMENLAEVVTHYRLHPAQTSVQKAAVMAANARRARETLLTAIGVETSATERDLHDALSMDRLQPTAPFVQAATVWLEKLLTANAQSRILDQEAFSRVLTGRYTSMRRRAGAAADSVQRVEAFERWVSQ